MNRLKLALCVAAPLWFGCPDEKKPAAPKIPETKFLQFVTVLRRPADPTREAEVAKFAKPLCAEDAAERGKFAQELKSAVDGKIIDPKEASNVVEFVATSCGRPDSGLELLAQTKAVLGNPPRLDLITARVAAGKNDLPTAIAAAKRAQQGGLLSAVGLLAQVQAEDVRSKSPTWVPGSLDEAIATTQVDESKITDIADLSAILSVRAHLNAEKAFWETGDVALQAANEARSLFQRLSDAKFPKNLRTRALDYACFHEAGDTANPPFPACARAAAETSNLGAAKSAGSPTDQGFDSARLAKLEELAAKLPKKGAVVLLVARGDEGDMLHWGAPLQYLLTHLNGVKFVLADGMTAPRAKAIVGRALEVAKSQVVEKVDVQALGPQATSCVATLLAGKPKLESCPLTPEVAAKLQKTGKADLAMFVGRDIDPDLQDVKTAGIPTALLSFRTTAVDGGPDYWLKSISDVLVLAPRPKK